MDSYEFEREIWQRVLSSDQPDENAQQASAVQQVLKQTLAAEQCYTCLACRTNGCCRQTLQQLAREKRCQAKQLETVYYLLTGCCAKTECCPCSCRGNLCELIRCRFTAELRAADGYCRAAEQFRQFSSLYASLSRAAVRDAEKLRCVLQALL